MGKQAGADELNIVRMFETLNGKMIRRFQSKAKLRLDPEACADKLRPQCFKFLLVLII